MIVSFVVIILYKILDNEKNSKIILNCLCVTIHHGSFWKTKKWTVRLNFFYLFFQSQNFIYIFSNQAIADYLLTNGYNVSVKEFCREANVVCLR